MADMRPVRSDTSSTHRPITTEELRCNVREAAECYFDDTMQRPSLIRLHFVRDEVLAL